MVNILANITRKCTSRIREQLPTPIHLHQHIKTTILLTSSCSYTHNITFLILLLKKKGRTSQKMATLQPSMFLLLITNMSFITGQFSTKGKEVHIILVYLPKTAEGIAQANTEICLITSAKMMPRQIMFFQLLPWQLFC